MAHRAITKLGGTAALGLVVLGLAALDGGCNVILGAGDYHVGNSGGAGTGSSSSTGSQGGSSATGCVDSPAGCFCGTPTTREEFLNACTNAHCEVFDKTRVTGLNADGSRPDLPLGTTSSTSASTSVASSSSSTGTGGGGNVVCGDLPNPVYVTGSSAVKPFLSVIAQYLGSQSEMTVVYQSQGSCVGVDAVLNATPMKKTASYWDPAQPNVSLGIKTCDLDPDGQAADIGVSDVFATTCYALPQGLPNGVSDSFGPVQAMAMVTGATSNEKSISSDAAYFVYGFGNGSGVAPWNDETFIFQRSATSGTQNVVAKGIGIPADKFLGKKSSSSDLMLAALLAAFQQPSGPAKAIGLLAADYADTNRSKLSVLAFQDRGQTCGYYPDSTPTSLDKQNVRDGHYPLWGPIHLLTKNPSALAQKLVNYIGGVSPFQGLNLIQLYVDSHVIPLCAMLVTRSSDGGPLSKYTPSTPCNCVFEAQATGTTTCKPCTSSSECSAAAPNCSFGYCEK